MTFFKLTIFDVKTDEFTHKRKYESKFILKVIKSEQNCLELSNLSRFATVIQVPFMYHPLPTSNIVSHHI